MPAHSIRLAALAMFSLNSARAVDYHVATGQDLQNALTLAAANGANNNIYLTNGYYIGNFNYNSSAGLNLTVTNEPGVTNTQITLDGAGGGRALSIASSGTSAITVAGLTFSRNCGSTTIGALRIAGGGGSVILVNGCQFLSPTNTSGMGLELVSGQNAIVTNCTATGSTVGGGGTGISIAGLTGNVNVQNCTFTRNTGVYPQYLAGLYVSGSAFIAVTGSIFAGNSSGSGANCQGATVTLSGNIFSGNAGENSAGGAYCSGTSLTLSGNNFISNSVSGEVAWGAGAFCSGTTITLSGNNFTGNSGVTGYYAGAGGGAYCSGTTLTISGNMFVNNSTAGQGGNEVNGGGGVWCQCTSLLLYGNTFLGNSANNDVGGGGAYCSCSGSVTMTNNSFAGNSTSSGSGGGAWCSGSITLTNNSFTGNSAGGSGGGAYCNGTPITLLANTFNLNSAATGGGIYASGQQITLLDNLVAKNSQTGSSSQGGGIWMDASSNLFFINNTITGNTAAGSGGGAAFEVTGVVELLNVYNNIIWGNSATGSGGDVWLAGTGQKKVFNFNDANSLYGVWDIAVNNMDVSPQFFDPVNGDYHFPGTSPCANAGTNGAPSMPLTDLDGNSRTNSAGLVDMGCYEFNTTATHPADTDNNFVITPAEFYAYAAAWQNGQTWTNAPNPIPANYLTRAGYLMTNGGAYYNNGSARPLNWKLIGH